METYLLRNKSSNGSPERQRQLLYIAPKMLISPEVDGV